MITKTIKRVNSNTIVIAVDSDTVDTEGVEECVAKYFAKYAMHVKVFNATCWMDAKMGAVTLHMPDHFNADFMYADIMYHEDFGI